MRTASACAAALTALALALPAAAQHDTLKKIAATGSIAIGHRDASIPFSYYDDQQRPIGYAMDLCYRVVEAVKNELKMHKVDVKYQLVTPANRVALMANGTIDLECGSTTNNLERQEQVWFTITHFVAAIRFVAKKSANLRKLEDLKGKTVVSTAGTTSIKRITELNSQKNLGARIVSANGHPEAFLMVETGRAAAFVMDDILLYGLVASSESPADYAIGEQALSLEPYGIMLRKGDIAFKKVVDGAMTQMYRSGQIDAIYEKWFHRPIPPKHITLNVPVSAQFKKVIANPTFSGDPNDYE